MNPLTIEPYLAAQTPAAPWQERVIEERRELAEKIVKLAAFLESQPPHVDGVDLELLARQRQAMHEYLATLDCRIARF